MKDPAPPPEELPSPLYAVAPETVRITVMWTGDPAELDLALLALRETASLGAVAAAATRHRARAASLALAGQLLAGALGEDEDDDTDEEPHEHLTVVRHDRGGAA